MAGRNLSLTAISALLAFGPLRTETAAADARYAQAPPARSEAAPAADDKTQGEHKERRERPKGEEKAPPGKREPREEPKPHKSEPAPQPRPPQPPAGSPARPAEEHKAPRPSSAPPSPESPAAPTSPAKPAAPDTPRTAPKDSGGPPAATKSGEPHARGVPPPASSAPSDASKHAPPAPSPAPAEPARPQSQAPAGPPPSAAEAGRRDAQPQVPGARRLDQIRGARVERKEDAGRRTVVTEPGGRVIVKQDNRVVIQHNEAARFARLPNAETKQRGDGISETVYVRPGGIRIVTEVDGGGRLVRRYRRLPDGREDILIDNRDFWRRAAVGVGVGVGLAIALNLPPPRVTLPRERYIVEYDRASDDDLYETLTAPPVDALDRIYSLEEVRYSHELRERMRRVDLDTVTFDFGAFDVSPEQFSRLERIAHVMQRILDRHPDEVFLIEGHTDAVGSEFDNLSLSDRRAEAVAQVLTDIFKIPPENLVTQGYGEQFLKVHTQEAERANRRVAVRRITPLMSRR